MPLITRQDRLKFQECVLELVLYDFSAGTDRKLQNKDRFTTLVRLLPSQIFEYSRCFAKLLRHYNWTKVAVICDPASSDDPFYQQTCSDFEKVLMTNAGRARAYIDASYVMKVDTSVEAQRWTALMDARTRSRGETKQKTGNIVENDSFTNASTQIVFGALRKNTVKSR